MKDILKERMEFILSIETDEEAQEIEWMMCKKDILHFFKNYLYTDKNTNLFTDDSPSRLPFIPFEFQEELITEIWSSIMNWTKALKDRDDFTNVFVEKSRQMWVSWVVMGIFLYGFLFHNHKYLVISQKENDVDKIWDMKSLFEKVRFMIRELPHWMLPKGFSVWAWSEHNKHMSISRSDWTWSITWESANPNASRWWTYQAVFMDEMAFMQNAMTINTAAASATPCRIFNSTPNGEGNEFYRMRRLTMERKDDRWNILEPEIKWLRYHWSDHPLYDDKRYQWKKRGMTEEKIAQELEINYNVALEGRVYKWFKWESWRLEYDPVRPLYVWIDNSHWGRDPHAIVIAQTDPQNHFIDVIDTIQFNCSIPEMCNFLAGTPKMWLNNLESDFLQRYMNYNWKMATFVWDPYDTNTTIRNIHNTQWVVISEEYRKVGIHMNTPQRIDVKTRIMNTQAQIYRLRVDERCMDFISSIQNARYPTVPETSARTTVPDKPIHDWTSHYRTALEYGVAWLLENEVKPQKTAKDTRPRRDFRTWKLVYSKT